MADAPSLCYIYVQSDSSSYGGIDFVHASQYPFVVYTLKFLFFLQPQSQVSGLRPLIPLSHFSLDRYRHDMIKRKDAVIAFFPIM